MDDWEEDGVDPGVEGAKVSGTLRHLRPPLSQLQWGMSKLVPNFVLNSYIIRPVLVRTYSIISLLSPNYVSDLALLGEVFRSIHHNYVSFF